MKYQFDEENHLHSLDGKPLIGTSTVLNVLSKPLTWWASGLAVAELGWIKKADPRKATPKEIEANEAARRAKAYEMLKAFERMDVVQYTALLDKAYKAHSVKLEKSADKGTDMHAELEQYVKHCIANDGVLRTSERHPAVNQFSEWAMENVNRFIVSEGHCYSEKLWTGGISDLLFEDSQGRLAVMDFKSSKEAYLSQFFQVAGYDIEISENGLFDAAGNLLYKPDREISYYAVFPFGMEHPEPQFHYDTKGAQEGFRAAVVLYKLINQN